MTLPAFAAGRRAVAPLLLGARHCRSIPPARMVLISKPVACRYSGRMMGQTNGRTPDRYIDSAPYTVQAVPI